MLDKKGKIAFAKKKCAEVYGFEADVFSKKRNIFCSPGPHFFEIITFGENALIACDDSIRDWCENKFSHLSAKEIMGGNNLYTIEEKLREYGKRLAGEHVRYLYLNPQTNLCKPQGFTYKTYDAGNISDLNIYRHFGNALNFVTDIKAIGAYDGDILAALAGGDNMKGDDFPQIGCDTDIAYRKRGLASYLVKRLAEMFEESGAVPFYTTWSPNIASSLTALRAGFVPCWVQYFSVDV